MSSLETIHEEHQPHEDKKDDCDYIIHNKDNTITICKKKIEEIIVEESSLYYNFGLVDGFLLGVAATMLTFMYKERAATALKTLGETLRDIMRR